jgi:transcription antitermination factor NusG
MVVWTESRAEKKVASRIEALGMDSWLPTVTEKHQWSDRSRRVVLPLFPGYIFARAGSAELSKVLRTPGVLTVVKTGGRPAVLSDAFVAGLRSALENPDLAPEAVATTRKYSVHDEIVVQHGPLDRKSVV